jgi:hypothetical protein
MADPHIIAALSRKRIEISRAIADLERQVTVQRALLAHVDATLMIFDPDMKLEAVPSRRLAQTIGRFATGDISGACMAAIREADGLVRSRDIALRLMGSYGMDAKDSKLRREVQASVRNALMGYRRRGVLESVGTGWDTRWRLAGKLGEQA